MLIKVTGLLLPLREEKAPLKPEDSKTYVLELMTDQEPKRRTTSITVDSRVLEKLKELADNKGISMSRYIEEYFFNEFKRIGIFSQEIQPCKETRGGDRTKSSGE